MPSGMAVFVPAGKEATLETRIGAISILVEEPESAEALNAVLHEYAACILGRMGIPYRETGKIGRLPGISAKAIYSRGSGARTADNQ